MARRTVALCEGKFIGIETIYTVVNGQQINIHEKLKELRTKSRNNELFCPCGCGANLILVAGDKNLREQHFRIKDGYFNQDCNVIMEGKTSVDSKIVLKCWLDDKLMATDIESRVPIRAVDDISRNHEFTFLSKSRKMALSYCHERFNLSDEKLSLLESNSQGIHIIYIVDCKNGGSEGQYPESLMKVQQRQGYCLLLTVDNADYNTAEMKAAFYTQDIDGLWQEIVFAEGLLRNFDINCDGQILQAEEVLGDKLSKAMDDFNLDIEREKIRRAEKTKRYFLQQETQVRDSNGNRWIKCEFCGKIAKDSDFNSYGGKGHINLGTCKDCSLNNTVVAQKIEEQAAKIHAKHDSAICPECGGRLRERNGRYGRFIGCSNYPTCRYTV